MNELHIYRQPGKQTDRDDENEHSLHFHLHQIAFNFSSTFARGWMHGMGKAGGAHDDDKGCDIHDQ